MFFVFLTICWTCLHKLLLFQLCQNIDIFSPYLLHLLHFLYYLIFVSIPVNKIKFFVSIIQILFLKLSVQHVCILPHAGNSNWTVSFFFYYRFSFFLPAIIVTVKIKPISDLLLNNL